MAEVDKKNSSNPANIAQLESSDQSTIVDGQTQLMAIIGDPITQVKTPQVINPIFEAMGENIVCVPLHITAEELGEAWVGLKAMRNLVGFGVTIPHKTRAYELCDSLDPMAEKVGAVNVVRREANGEFRGYQFDGVGFVRGLKSRRHDPSGMDCMIIGAGGAAAAIAFELLESGAAAITIANRTREKAVALVNKLNERAGSTIAKIADPAAKDHQMIVNATSLGMEMDDPCPMPVDMINATNLVAEVVAKPRITRFLEAAARQGAAIHSGEYMVNYQVDLIARHLSSNDSI